MSIYYKESVVYFEEAINSMWEQTVPPEEIVLVCDGPLTEELDKSIGDMQSMHSSLHVVRLEKNSGLGNALNVGIKHCKNDLIARMDTDDISRTDRCERQLSVFSSMPEIDICSGTIEEFTDSISIVNNRRVTPETHDQIIAFSKKRNPFNHPCVMYRKTAVEAAGGYQDFYLLEDYYLWIRMLQNGSHGYNIQEPLLWMRAGSAMYKRRSGWKYARSQKELFKYMYTEGIITRSDYFRSAFIRGASSLTPNWIRRMAFKSLLRENASE